MDEPGRELPAELQKPLEAARRALLANACAEASRLMDALLREQRKLATAHYYRGAALCCRARFGDGIEAYRQAMAQDPRYRQDPRILEDAGRMMKVPRLRLATIDFLWHEIGAPAIPLLREAAEQRTYDVRRRATAALRDLGAEDKIDELRQLELDLDQLRSCDARRETVGRLREIEAPRALEVLRRARDQSRGGLLSRIFKGRYRHGCIRAEILEAIAHLEDQLR